MIILYYISDQIWSIGERASVSYQENNALVKDAQKKISLINCGFYNLSIQEKSVDIVKLISAVEWNT